MASRVQGVFGENPRYEAVLQTRLQKDREVFFVLHRHPPENLDEIPRPIQDRLPQNSETQRGQENGPARNAIFPDQ